MLKVIRLSLILLAVCAPCRAASVDSLRREAAEYSRKGMHLEAAQAFERAVQADPGNLRLLKDYMWALWNAKQYPETVAAAQKALTLAKNDLEALNMVGRAQEQGGDALGAKRAYERSLEISPKQMPIIRALGRVYYDLKDYEGSLRIYRDYLSRQPDDAGVHAAIGRIAFHQERYDDALTSYEKALTLAPEEPKYKLGKAQALYHAGRVSDSIAILRDLARARPTDWPSVQFLVAVASVTKNIPLAYTTLEENLREVTPQDEGTLMQLSELYRDLGMNEQFRASLNRLLSMNQQHGPAMLEKAQLLLDHGSPREANAIYQQVARLNPGSVFAWTGIAEAASASSQTARALDAVEQALKLDPTDPDLILRKANYMYQDGRFEGARDLLVKWLEKNPEQTLSVILYHGIVRYENDPALVAPTNVTADALDRQLKALKDAGYASITVQQAVDWFNGKGEIPKKSVLITFDDARLDSFVNGDPILKKHGFNAVMFAPIHNVAGNLPGYASWKEVANYHGNGRWEVQAHGDAGHTYVQTDAAGRKGLFLPNRRWNERERRMETAAEWADRVRADHESSKAKLLEKLGKPALAFAWPEGDFGQFGVPNLPQSAEENLRFCRDAYAICFTQNEVGVNVRTRDRARVYRVEPREAWSGRQLVEVITDQTPFVRMRRHLLQMATWQGKPQEAYEWLRKNEKVVSSKAVILADEAIIHRDMGDFARGMAAAKQAQALSESAENALLVESMRQRVQPDWTGSLTHFSDNQTRRDIVFRQSVGSFLLKGNVLRISHFHGSHVQDRFPSVSDNGLGLMLSRGLGLYHSLNLQLDNHLYSGRVGSMVGISGALRTRWADHLETEVTAGKVPYELASALRIRTEDHYAGLRATYDTRDSWKGYVTARGANVSDTEGNRFGGSAHISHPISSGSKLRVAARASYDNVHRRSENYYSPQRLRTYQGGLSYDADLDKGLHFAASYLPGVAEEGGTKAKFVNVYEASVRWEYTPSFSINPEFWVTDTPAYNSTFFNIMVVYRFDDPRKAR